MAKDVKTKLYETVHRSKKTVQQIADETGISANYLYRACLPVAAESNSGVRFPLDFLIPLMKSTKNYAVLKHIADICGYVLVRVPRVKAMKDEEQSFADDYSMKTAECTKAMRDFFNKPTQDGYEKVTECLRDVMTISAQAEKYCGKRMQGQLEMEL